MCIGLHGSKYASLFPVRSLERLHFRPTLLTERHCSENENHGLDACFSVESIYYINSSMTVLYMIVGSLALRTSMLFCRVFPGRGVHNSKSPSPLSGSSADTFVPFPSTLTAHPRRSSGKVMNARTLIPFDLAFHICGNFRHVLGFRCC
jgi:hypothetical protein